MTHKSRILIIALSAAATLGLSACDNSQDGGNADAQSEATPPAAAQDTAAAATGITGEAASEGAAAADASAAPATSAASAELAATPYTQQVIIHRDENGVPTGEMTMGNPDADLEIVEYLSVTCGHCAAHHVNTWQAVKETYVATGKAKARFRMFARSPLDELISMLPFCGTDEQAYPILDMIMSRQNQWLRGANGQEVLNNVAGLVRRAGMSRASFDACVRTQPLLENIRATTRSGAEDDSVNSTPSFVFGSQRFSGAVSFEEFAKRIEDEL